MNTYIHTYIHTNVYIYVYMYLFNSSVTSGMRHKVNVDAEYYWFEFVVFLLLLLLLDWLPKEASLPNCLLIAKGELGEFLPFP